MPPKYRKELEDGLMLTMGPDNCIRAYTKNDWLKMAANQAPSNLLSSDAQRKLNRFFFSNANELSLDNQGRIAIPAILREKCGMSDSAVIAGINTYFEIWSPAGFDKERPTADEARELMDKLEERK